MSRSVSVRLDDATLESLDLMAKASERSRAWLMAQAVRQYVEHEAWQVEAVRHAMDKLEGGRAKFADHEAVEQWVESWGAADEQAHPRCD